MRRQIRAFANGAYIVPLRLENGKFVWTVDGFEDDTYLDGVTINPALSARNIKDLLFEEDYEYDSDDEEQQQAVFEQYGIE